MIAYAANVLAGREREREREREERRRERERKRGREREKERERRLRNKECERERETGYNARACVSVCLPGAHTNTDVSGRSGVYDRCTVLRFRCRLN